MLTTTKSFKPGPQKAEVVERRMQALFDFIVRYKWEHDGCSPTHREMGRGVHMAPGAVLTFYLNRLHARGLIFFGPNETRQIQVVGARWLSPQEAEAKGL